MLNQLTLANFKARLNETFLIHLEELDAPLTAELIEVVPLGSNIEQQEQELGRRSFSLVFRGPPEPLLIQQLYELENESMGKLALFLVPIGPDQTGMKYEAIFT